MIIKKLIFNKLTIPYTNQFINSQKKYSKREIIYVKLFDENENIGIGEIAPIQPHSKLQINKILEILNEKEGSFINKRIDAYSDYLDNIAEYDSEIRFGLESAFLNLILKSKNNINIPFRNKIEHAIINTNYLITQTNPFEVIDFINSKLDKGINSFKIKFGIQKFEDDLFLLKRISENFQNRINVRIDLNGKWNKSESVIKIKQIIECKCLDYIEEPTSGLKNLIELANIYSNKIAVDESLVNIENVQQNIEKMKNLTVILKPSQLGSITENLVLIDLLKANKIRTVITSAFETNVGREFVYFLASQISDETHGIATNKVLDEKAEDVYFINDKFIFDDQLFLRK